MEGSGPGEAGPPCPGSCHLSPSETCHPAVGLKSHTTPSFVHSSLMCSANVRSVGRTHRGQESGRGGAWRTPPVAHAQSLLCPRSTHREGSQKGHGGTLKTIQLQRRENRRAEGCLSPDPPRVTGTHTGQARGAPRHHPFLPVLRAPRHPQVVEAPPLLAAVPRPPGPPQQEGPRVGRPWRGWPQPPRPAHSPLPADAPLLPWPAP